MNIKILIILIILIGLGIGGFFIFKKEFPSEEKETPLGEEIPPSAEKAEELNLNWQEDAGTRVSDGSVPYVYKLKDGRYRLYYCGAGGILSAVSPDGLDFQKEGLRIDSENTGDGGWASVPEAIRLSDGRIRIYYVSGDFAAGGGIMSAISNDGLNFQKETGARVKGMVDPAIIILPDGKYLLLVISLDPRLSPYLPRGIYSYLSQDGLNFENRKVILQKDGAYDPTIIKIDSESYRIYYGEDIGGQLGQPNVVTKSLIGRLK